MLNLDELIHSTTQLVEQRLAELLPAEDAEPSATLHRAMRYSIFAGGKRIRPPFRMRRTAGILKMRIIHKKFSF